MTRPPVKEHFCPAYIFYAYFSNPRRWAWIFSCDYQLENGSILG
jgi:hypothetical protein